MKRARDLLGCAWPGDLRASFFMETPALVSRFCGDALWARLRSLGDFKGCRPVLLGSWARGELCPKSDIDILFIGEESRVAEFVEAAQAGGLKLRYRVPEDPEDWTVGVEPFDILALFQARAIYDEEKEPIRRQQENLWKKGLAFRKQLYRSVREERLNRADRYDSQANYLEPNLKYGPGGLRDIEQGIVLSELFKDLFADGQEHVLRRLKEIKSLILFLRQFAQLHGASETLAGTLQKDLADHVGASSVRAMMSDVEFALSEGSFYADWVSDAVKQGHKRLRAIQAWQPASAEEALAELKKDPSVLRQERLRAARITLPKKSGAKIFSRYFNTEMSEAFLNALYRSRLFETFVPEFKEITGLVQHDQYHRYSVDAHIVQAMREVLRTKKFPMRLGRMGKLARKLAPADWRMLLWQALFHDIGKGREKDHSEEGQVIAKKRLVALGLSLRETVEVAWLVRHHLILSAAAFRRNPQSPALWSELFARGVKRERIARLGVFTAIDIRSTNPDAWNEWKDRLLYELCETLRSPKAGELSKLLEKAERSKFKLSRELIESLPAEVVSGVKHDVLLKDLRSLQTGKANLPPLVLRAGKDGLWVRFQEREDRPGLFLSFAQRLFDCGLNVMASFVATMPGYGAYDWFLVRSKRDPRIVRGWLEKSGSPSARPETKVIFDVLELVAKDKDSAIISLRGKDQAGALVHAAKALHAEGFTIQSAKVNTWGRQIDDVFTVGLVEDFEEKMSGLKSRLLAQSKR